MDAPPVPLHDLVESGLDCGLRSAERATGGRIAATYVLELDDDPGRAVCKIGGASIRTGDVIEPFVLRLVRSSTDVPCPAVYASGTARDRSGNRTAWALYEYRDGRTPTDFRSLDPSVRDRIIGETGEMLGELHATHQYERTGGFGRRNGNLCLRPPNGVNVPERGRRLLAARSGVDSSDWQPVLGHGDLFPENLLVREDGAISAVLDWGNAHVTTAGYALARAELRFVDWFRFPADERSRHRASLRRGYETHRPVPEEYRAHANVYKLLWLGQSLDRIGRHLLTGRGRGQLRRHVRSLLSRD